MRRMLIGFTILAVLTLPAAASARARGPAKPGFLVVRKGTTDGGVSGRPVATVVMQGFVLGRVSQEGRVDIYQLPSAAGRGAPQVAGADVSTSAIRWRGFTGKEYRGSNFRFSATDGFYRVVVHGSRVYLFAGGRGNVRLRGSSVYRHADGTYSIDGGHFRSLPQKLLKRRIGQG
jgi:hypothetical protein